MEIEINSLFPTLSANRSAIVGSDDYGAPPQLHTAARTIVLDEKGLILKVSDHPEFRTNYIIEPGEHFCMGSRPLDRVVQETWTYAQLALYTGRIQKTYINNNPKSYYQSVEIRTFVPPGTPNRVIIQITPTHFNPPKRASNRK